MIPSHLELADYHVLFLCLWTILINAYIYISLNVIVFKIGQKKPCVLAVFIQFMNLRVLRHLCATGARCDQYPKSRMPHMEAKIAGKRSRTYAGDQNYQQNYKVLYR